MTGMVSALIHRKYEFMAFKGKSDEKMTFVRDIQDSFSSLTNQTTRLAGLVLCVGTSCAIIGSTALPTWGATAATAHPHSDIVGVVEAAALSAAANEGLDGIEVRVRPLDARLRPAQCDQALEISRSHAGRVLGAVSYGVRCASPSPWTLYLRADVSANT